MLEVEIHTIFDLFSNRICDLKRQIEDLLKSANIQVFRVSAVASASSGMFIRIYCEPQESLGIAESISKETGLDVSVIGARVFFSAKKE